MVDGQSIENWATILAAILDDARFLPSRQAGRRRFSPSMSYGRHFVPPLPSAKQASVMLMLKRSQTGWSIPLTERPRHLPDHPGQISLPGGRVERGESHVAAAIREFNEELGTPDFPGIVVGALQPIYVYNSDYCVTPFVAINDRSFEYRPCEQEVARVIELPTEQLLDDSQIVIRPHSRGMLRWTAPEWQCQGSSIWGATAMILGEFSEVLRRAITYQEES